MDLFVSIPPSTRRNAVGGEEIGEAYADECVASWAACGFEARNVVSGDEATPVAPHHRVDESVPRFYPGRYGPPLGAVFDLVRDGEPVAITNADIRLLPFEDRAGFVELARDEFVFAQRIDVPSPWLERYTLFEWGIDFVAFAGDKIRPVLDHPELRKLQLGCPWWDYTLPIAASFFVPVTKITSPFVFHLHHLTRWDTSNFDELAPKIAQIFADLAEQAGSENGALFLERLRALPVDDKGRVRPDNLAQLCFDWYTSDRIKTRAFKVRSDVLETMLWEAACEEARPKPGPTMVVKLRMPDLDRWPTPADALKAIGNDFIAITRGSLKVIERSLRPYFKGTRRSARSGDEG